MATRPDEANTEPIPTLPDCPLADEDGLPLPIAEPEKFLPPPVMKALYNAGWIVAIAIVVAVLIGILIRTIIWMVGV